MHSASPATTDVADAAGRAGPRTPDPYVPQPVPPSLPDQAAMAPMPEPVAVTDNPLSARRTDSRAEAAGRRTLSTAFVMIGPDGHLTVSLRDGRMLVLRKVAMHARDFCGVLVAGGAAGKRYCGGYADVAAARPGDGPAVGRADLRASDTLAPAG